MAIHTSTVSIVLSRWAHLGTTFGGGAARRDRHCAPRGRAVEGGVPAARAGQFALTVAEGERNAPTFAVGPDTFYFPRPATRLIVAAMMTTPKT
jgi:hypothetical protein